METVEKAALKLLETVRVLHERGFELIRIFPYDAPSGCYWRCTISTKKNFDKKYGLMPKKDTDKNTLYYSTGAVYEYFEGYDGEHATVENIADELLKRIPELELKGKGSDPDYMEWFHKVLTQARLGHFAYAMADGYFCLEEGYIHCGTEKLELPKY